MVALLGPVTMESSDPGLDTLMGALAELDMLAVTDDPHRLIAAAQLSYGLNLELPEDLMGSIPSA